MEDQIQILYFVKMNNTYYRATETLGRDNYKNLFVFPYDEYPYIDVRTVTGQSISFSVTPKDVSFRITTLIVLGSSLFGDECVLPEDIKDEDLDISDFYDQQIVLLHSHVNGGVHNHTRRATGGSNIVYNFKGILEKSAPLPQRVFSYSKNNDTGTNDPFYLVSSVGSVKTSTPYKIQLGGNDFVISYFGWFNLSTDSDAIHKVPFRVYFGEFVSKAIGDANGKYIPDGATSATVAKSTLKMHIMLDQDNKRLQGSIYGELGTRNISETNLKWHPTFPNEFQLTIYYDHDARQLKIYSSLISKNNIAANALDNTRYLLHTENNVLFSTLENAFFQFGPDSSELLNVPYTASTNNALSKYAASLTDMVAVGFSDLIVCGKIYYCTTSFINSQIKGNLRLKTNEVKDLWIIGNDTERKSTKNTGLITNITNFKDQLGITDLGGEVLNGLWCTHYTLNPAEYGTYTVTSSYSNTSDKSPYRYECHVDLKIQVIIVPSFTISAQGSSTSSLQDIGSNSRPKFSVNSGDDFNLIVETNYDQMPVLVNNTALDIRSGSRVSSKKFSFLVKPDDLGTFNIKFQYNASDYNEAKDISVEINVLENKKDSEIEIQNSSGTTMTKTSIMSGDVQTFQVITNKPKRPDCEVSQRRAAAVSHQLTEAIDNGYHKHTYELHGQFPAQNVMILFSYEDDGLYRSTSQSFMVDVETIPLNPWIDPESAAMVILQKSEGGAWNHALSLDTSGTVLHKTDVTTTIALKDQLKSFAEDLKT